MTGGRSRMGPHIGFAAHLLGRSEVLESWFVQRDQVLALTTAPAAAAAVPPITGAPTIRFARVAEARAWFGDTVDAIVFTWTLSGRAGVHVASSASAFPAIMMAERDARLIQEFAEQLDLRFAVNPSTSEVAWSAWRHGIPILVGVGWHPSERSALSAAAAAVGLLPIATIAAYAVGADHVNPAP